MFFWSVFLKTHKKKLLTVKNATTRRFCCILFSQYKFLSFRSQKKCKHYNGKTKTPCCSILQNSICTKKYCKKCIYIILYIVFHVEKVVMSLKSTIMLQTFPSCGLFSFDMYCRQGITFCRCSCLCSHSSPPPAGCLHG